MWRFPQSFFKMCVNLPLDVPRMSGLHEGAVLCILASRIKDAASRKGRRMDQFGLFGEPEALEEPQDISPDDVFSNASNDFLDEESVIQEDDLLEEEESVVESEPEEEILVVVPEIVPVLIPDPILPVAVMPVEASAVVETVKDPASSNRLEIPKYRIMTIESSRTISDKIIDVKAEILKATQGGDIDIAKLEMLIAKIKDLESIASKKAELIERIDACEDQSLIGSLLELLEGKKTAPRILPRTDKVPGRTCFDLKPSHDVNGLLATMQKGSQYKISDLLRAVGIVRGMDLNGAASFDAYVLKYKSEILKTLIKDSKVATQGEKARTLYFLV